MSKTIPDDEIRYIPKGKFDELQQRISSATEFSVVKTGHQKEQKDDLLEQIANSTEEDDGSISDEEFSDLTAQIKAKIAKENPSLVEAAEAEKRNKTYKTPEQAMKELKEIKKLDSNGVFGAVKLR